MKNWANTQGSDIKTGEGFVVAYSPPPKHDPKVMLMQAMGYEIDMDPFTALMRGDERYILKGDHKEAYDALIEHGWEACFAYYTSNQSMRHPKSTDALREKRAKTLN